MESLNRTYDASMSLSFSGAASYLDPKIPTVSFLKSHSSEFPHYQAKYIHVRFVKPLPQVQNSVFLNSADCYSMCRYCIL